MAKTGIKKGKAKPAALKAPEEGGTILSMEEAIQMLKTTRPSFYRWLRAGKFTGMKVGRQWRFYKEEVERFMKGEEPRIDLPVGAGPMVKKLEDKIKELSGEIDLPPREGDLVSDIGRSVRLIILLGNTLRASDIHLEPGQETFRVRYRVDGVLQPALDFDNRWLSAVINQFKAMAGCRVSEKMRPQDGHLELAFQGRTLKLRVAFMQAAAGESATLRFVDSGWAESMTLDKVLSTTPVTHERILRVLKSPYGLFLTVGPTGSGKTVLLYALLNQLISADKKVVSIENPVMPMPGVLQMKTYPELGQTYASLLRSVSKMDPNVIMLTELPDAETMDIAIKAALTGHMVLSSLHTEDSASTLRRMVDFGLDPVYIGDATVGILSQRLLRKVCEHCAVKDAPAAVDLEWAKKVCAAGGLDFGSLPGDYRRPVGCPKCNHTGYKGRTPVVELLEVTPEIKIGLRHGASVEQLRAVAIQQGMVTQAAEAVRKAAIGLTTLSEATRVSR